MMTRRVWWAALTATALTVWAACGGDDDKKTTQPPLPPPPEPFVFDTNDNLANPSVFRNGAQTWLMYVQGTAGQMAAVDATTKAAPTGLTWPAFAQFTALLPGQMYPTSDGEVVYQSAAQQFTVWRRTRAPVVLNTQGEPFPSSALLTNAGTPFLVYITRAAPRLFAQNAFTNPNERSGVLLYNNAVVQPTLTAFFISGAEKRFWVAKKTTGVGGDTYAIDEFTFDFELIGGQTQLKPIDAPVAGWTVPSEVRQITAGAGYVVWINVNNRISFRDRVKGGDAVDVADRSGARVGREPLPGQTAPRPNLALDGAHLAWSDNFEGGFENVFAVYLDQPPAPGTPWPITQVTNASRVQRDPAVVGTRIYWTEQVNRAVQPLGGEYQIWSWDHPRTPATPAP